MYKCSKCEDFCCSDNILLMQHEKTCNGEKFKWIPYDGVKTFKIFTKVLKWEPKEDITVYELACCMNVLIVFLVNSVEAFKQYDSLSPECKRHFKESE